MNICLVRCPSPFLIDERAFPPLGLLAVGAGLKQSGHEVVVYDGEIELLPMDYAYYGFGPTSPEYPAAVDCLHRIKSVNPSARVVIGGPHVTLTRTRDDFDCMVIGDGELAAHEAFASDVSEVVAADLPLDQYPIPDRSLVDIKSYNFRLHNRKTTSVVGSRGCPWACAFCSKNHNRVRMNSATRIIEEIGILYEQFGYDAIAFPEDIFILDKKRTAEVCRFMKQRGIIWRCLVRADLIIKYGHDFIDMMVDSGCVGVGMGMESGSNTILRNINKRETVEQLLEAVQMLRSRGAFIKGFFIVGLPGENEETLAETEAFLSKARLDDVDIKIFQPYPASPIYDHPERYDVRWQTIPLEYTFYKGLPGEYYGNVSTSALSTERIIEAWKYFEQTYKDWTYAMEGTMCAERMRE
ncbi:MAG: B12-binding domain-containing radical SAM protein [Gammaproteobacteria bacterium]|nr:B12-binding domain-containing radical SAM protein [Gammaproteobacteria bacterium]